MDTNKLFQNMEVKIVLQGKKIREIQEQNEYLKSDLNK